MREEHMADISAKIPVILFQEGDKTIAYSPALDLSTCGDTEQQARRRFSEAALIYLSELMAMGTLDEVLEESGWQKDVRKHIWISPVYKSASEEVKIPTGV
jgi:hypothetical protein